jgi:hypothetical protein
MRVPQLIQGVHGVMHPLGSVALYELCHGLLLGGDAVQGHGTTDTLLPLIVDLPAYRRYVRRLAGLDVAVLVDTCLDKLGAQGLARCLSGSGCQPDTQVCSLLGDRLSLDVAAARAGRPA